MDFIQLWNEAIKQVAARSQDPSEQAIIQLFSTQVSLSVEHNSIRFLCNSLYIYNIFIHHAAAFFDEVSHLLNKTDLGFFFFFCNAANQGMARAQTGNSFNSPPSPPAQPQPYPAYTAAPQPGFAQTPRRVEAAGQQGRPFAHSGQIGAPQMGSVASSALGVAPTHLPDNRSYAPRPRFMRNDAINPNKTFDNYVTDPDNRLLVATAVAVAANPGTSNYNPFYIYGGSGLGKTHLLFAIANRIRKERPECSLIYIRAEEFIRHYVESTAKLSSKKNFDDQSVHFQDMYTENDVFIVDDIQNFIKGPKSRDAFFEIIADFIDRPNRQLILASDVAPGNLKGFSARLTSRFGSGVCCEVIPPSVETRTAIIMTKCKEIGISLSDDIVSYIASHIRSNVREIEGAIKTLFTQFSITHELTFDDSVRILSNLVNASNQVLSMDSIKERVAKEFEVQVAAMESAERKKTVSMARSMAMALIRELIPSASLTDIGRAFNKDHSSVYEAVSRVKGKMETDPELASKYHRLKLSLKND